MSVILTKTVAAIPVFWAEPTQANKRKLIIWLYGFTESREDVTDNLRDLAAAGYVASLTLLLLWAEDHDYRKFRESYIRYLLPAMLVFLSLMMVSQVKYPTFKKLDLRATRTFPKMVAIVLVVGFFILLWDKLLLFVLPALFTLYLLYGFVRPFISGRMRHEIEEEDDEEEETPPTG